MIITPRNFFIQRVEKLEHKHNFSQAQNESKLVLSILDSLNFIFGCAITIINYSLSPKTFFSGVAVSILNRNQSFAGVEVPITGSPQSPLRSPLAPIRSTYVNFQKIGLGYISSTIVVVALATIIYPFTSNPDYSLYNIYVDNFLNFIRSFFHLYISAEINEFISKIEAMTDRLYKQPRMNAFIKKLQEESPSNMKLFKSIFTDNIITYDLIIDPVVASNGRVYERESIVSWMNKLKAENNLITAPENRAEITTTLIEAEAIEVLIRELEDNPSMDLANSKALKDENNVKFITPYIDLKTGKTVEGSKINAKSNPKRYQRFFLLEELLTQLSQNIPKPKL